MGARKAAMERARGEQLRGIARSIDTLARREVASLRVLGTSAARRDDDDDLEVRFCEPGHARGDAPVDAAIGSVDGYDADDDDDDANDDDLFESLFGSVDAK